MFLYLEKCIDQVHWTQQLLKFFETKYVHVKFKIVIQIYIKLMAFSKRVFQIKKCYYLNQSMPTSQVSFPQKTSKPKKEKKTMKNQKKGMRSFTVLNCVVESGQKIQSLGSIKVGLFQGDASTSFFAAERTFPRKIISYFS